MTSKVIAILRTFGDATEHSLTEIARLSGLPISTTHRLTNELVMWGMLDRTDGGLYRVGLQLRTIASRSAAVPPSFHERARLVLEDLAHTMRCVVRLGVLEDLSVTYIEKCGPDRPCSSSGTTNLPAHATAMGKALLAFATPDVVDQVIERGLSRYTPLTITSADRLRRALSVTRLTRVAVARRELDARTRVWPRRCPARVGGWWPPSSWSASTSPTCGRCTRRSSWPPAVSPVSCRRRRPACPRPARAPSRRPSTARRSDAFVCGRSHVVAR